MSTPANVLLDGDDPCLSSYLSILESVDPLEWNAELGERAGLSELYNRSFNLHPNDRWYGILCDDAVPETPNWDRVLVRVASSDGMAVPAGTHDTRVDPHFVLGGDLVRDTGWVALPGLDRIYIDTVWKTISKRLGVYRYVHDVVVKHCHFSNGLALMDATYRKHNKDQDRRVFEAWATSYSVEGLVGDITY